MRADTSDRCHHVRCLYPHFLRPSLNSDPSVRSSNSTSNPANNSALRLLDPGRARPHTTRPLAGDRSKVRIIALNLITLIWHLREGVLPAGVDDVT